MVMTEFINLSILAKFLQPWVHKSRLDAATQLVIKLV